MYAVNDDDFIPNCDIINEKEQVCLLVGSAIENPVVYMQVIQVYNFNCILNIWFLTFLGMYWKII